MSFFSEDRATRYSFTRCQNQRRRLIQSIFQGAGEKLSPNDRNKNTSSSGNDTTSKGRKTGRKTAEKQENCALPKTENRRNSGEQGDTGAPEQRAKQDRTTKSNRKLHTWIRNQDTSTGLSTLIGASRTGQPLLTTRVLLFRRRGSRLQRGEERWSLT